MPEIEREAILAARQEEMQKYKDSQQLDAMYRMAGMGGDEESEEEPSRKKRELIGLYFLREDLPREIRVELSLTHLGKHTSVSKEATRAMKDLKNKRKAKDERDARKVSPEFPLSLSCMGAKLIYRLKDEKDAIVPTKMPHRALMRMARFPTRNLMFLTTPEPIPRTDHQ